MTGADIFAMTALTLRVGALATALALPVAIALAYVLARRSFRGKSALQTVLALPMVMPPVVVGLALLWLLGRRGPLAPVLDALGLELVFTQGAAVLAAAVVGFPLLVRACEQAFAQVDPRFAQVARSLGASPWQTFRRVTLPLARRGIAYGTLAQ